MGGGDLEGKTLRELEIEEAGLNTWATPRADERRFLHKRLSAEKRWVRSLRKARREQQGRLSEHTLERRARIKKLTEENARRRWKEERISQGKNPNPTLDDLLREAYAEADKLLSRRGAGLLGYGVRR